MRNESELTLLAFGRCSSDRFMMLDSIVVASLPRGNFASLGEELDRAGGIPPTKEVAPNGPKRSLSHRNGPF